MTEKEEKAIEEIKPWLEFEKSCECNKGILLLEYIETVIQALEQKDKEIQELKADRVEKDKLIDLMSKYISDEDTAEIFCVDDEDKICNDEECKKCVLQYFQKKAREENDRKIR